MKIAVLGYGNVGSNLGRGWMQKHQVVFGVRDVQKKEVKDFLSKDISKNSQTSSVPSFVASRGLRQLSEVQR